MKIKLMADCAYGLRRAVVELETSTARNVIRAGIGYRFLDEAEGTQVPTIPEDVLPPEKAEDPPEDPEPRTADEPPAPEAAVFPFRKKKKDRK